MKDGAQHQPGSATFWVIGLIVVVAALITNSIGTMTAPRNMPDERHHYAVVKHIADHFGEFPLRYETIWTDHRKDPNHLVHPPLYHYLMAAFYLALNPSRHFTSAGMDFDRHGSIQTSEAIIPVLRGFSQFWVYFGLVGVFFLLKDCMRRELLSPLLAIPCAAFLTFIPAFLFIGGSLNNDVLGLAFWPWLALAILDYWFNRNLTAFGRAWFFLGVLALTKATSWSICLVFGGLLMGKMVQDLRNSEWSICKAYRIKPVGATVWSLAACLLGCLVFWHLASQWHRYGALQPTYEKVYNIPLSKSKFLIVPSLEDVKKLPSTYFVALCASKLVQSLRGATSHLEIHGDPHSGLHLLWAFGALMLLALGSICFWRDPALLPLQKMLVLGFACLPVVNFFLMLRINHSFYIRTGNFAMEGRYFIGHLHFAILAAFMLLTYLWKNYRLRPVSLSAALTGCAILGWLFVQPFTFFNRTHEPFFQAEMQKIIPYQLLSEGFQKIELKALGSNGKTNRHLKWYSRLGTYYHVQTSQDGLQFFLPSHHGFWELRLLVQGSALPSPPRYLKVLEGKQANQQRGQEFNEVAQLELNRNIALVEFRLPGSQAGPDDSWVLRPVSLEIPGPLLDIELFKPRYLPIKVFSLYAKPVE